MTLTAAEESTSTEHISTDFIIDTDTHISEPPDLWTSRLPKSLGDDIIQVKWNEAQGAEWWTVSGKWLQPAWQTCQYERNVFPDSPPRFEDCHPASVIPAERVKVMDRAHVRAAVLYPNIGGLNAAHFEEMGNPELAASHIRAYNDFQVDYEAAFPGRFIPMAVVPFWDLEESVREIDRLGDKPFGGIVMTGAPHFHDQPFIGDQHWNKLWEACLAAKMSVSFHIGSGNLKSNLMADQWLIDPPGATLARTATQPFLDNGKQVTDLVMSGVLHRYPDLKFASVESGLGWVPFVLESMDYHYKRATQGQKNLPWGDLLPSDLFRRQVYINYWFEDLDPWYLDKISVDNIMFETDFPHPTCLTPEDMPQALARLGEATTEVREKIMWRNAATLYGLDEKELVKVPW